MVRSCSVVMASSCVIWRPSRLYVSMLVPFTPSCLRPLLSQYSMWRHNSWLYQHSLPTLDACGTRTFRIQSRQITYNTFLELQCCGCWWPSPQLNGEWLLLAVERLVLHPLTSGGRNESRIFMWLKREQPHEWMDGWSRYGRTYIRIHTYKLLRQLEKSILRTWRKCHQSG